MAKTSKKTAVDEAPTPQDVLEVRYIPLCDLRRWDRNPKQHNIGELIALFQQYGFKDPPKFEPALDGLVEGNGRFEALEVMKREGMAPPRGILTREDGEWLAPVIFGVDARNRFEAETYGVDHNNSNLSGGNLGVDSMLRLYDQAMLGEILSEAAGEGALPITLDGEDIDELLRSLDEGSSSHSGGGDPLGAGGGSHPDDLGGDRKQGGYREQYGVIVICDGEERQREVFEQLTAQGFNCRVVTT